MSVGEGREDPVGIETARAEAQRLAAKRAREARTRELTERFDREIAAMKARHQAEREALLREVEEAFAALREAERGEGE